MHLHISDASFYNTIYAGSGHKRDKCTWQQYRVEPQSMSRATVSTVRHDKHRARRQPLERFFSKKSIRDLDGLITAKMRLLCDRFGTCIKGKEEERTANLSVAFSALTMDVISTYCFGESIGCLDEEDWGREYRDMLNGGTTTVVFFQHFHALRSAIESFPPWALRMLNPRFEKMQGYHRLIDRCMERELKMHRAREGRDKERSRSTIFHEILNSDLPEEEKSKRRVTDEAIVLVGAGSETTARTLAVLSYYILADAQIEETLLAELRTVMRDVNSSVESARLEQLPFLVSMILQPCLQTHY